MSTTITVQFSTGPRAVDASELRTLVDTGRIAPTARVASLDAGKTWIAAADALAASGGPTVTSLNLGIASPEVVPDDAVAEAWGAGVDEGDPDWTSGWQRTPTRTVARLLALARTKLTAAFFQNGAGSSLSFGNIAIILAALIGFVIAIVHGTKSESFRVFLQGLVLPVVLLIAQYAANRAIGAGTRIVAHSRCSLRTRALLDLVALLALVGGIGAFAAGIAETVDAESYVGVFNGTAVLLVSWHLAALAFAPALVTTRIDHTVSAWKEAVGVLGTLAKIVLRLVPVVFGIFTVLLTIHLAWDSRLLFKLKEGMSAAPLQEGATAALTVLIKLALLPLAAYVVFSAWYATLALVEAVFHVERQGDRRTGA